MINQYKKLAKQIFKVAKLYIILQLTIAALAFLDWYTKQQRCSKFVIQRCYWWRDLYLAASSFFVITHVHNIQIWSGFTSLVKREPSEESREYFCKLNLTKYINTNTLVEVNVWMVRKHKIDALLQEMIPQS